MLSYKTGSNKSLKNDIAGKVGALITILLLTYYGRTNADFNVQKIDPFRSTLQIKTETATLQFRCSRLGNAVS